MRTIIAIFVLIAACGVDRGIETADVYKTYNQDKALLLMEARFDDYYGVRTDAFDHTQVYWCDTPCPYADDWAVVYKGKCYYGIEWNCDEIYVAMYRLDPNRTCHTALLHEFGHCLLGEAGMDRDIDHTNTELWDLVAQVRLETCDRGW